MTRYGMVIGLKPEAEQRYKEYHDAVWPGVLATIHACNIRNYSIYLHNHSLFAYFEYYGADFKADMARMAADKTTQEWWAIMEPMQEPLPDRKEGERWMRIEEVFHTD
jgi:L-rhamnose mutarotase